MKGIMLKDFYSLLYNNRVYLLMMGAFIFCSAVNDFSSTPIYMLLNYLMIYTGVLPCNIMENDEKDEWNKYEYSLPISRRKIVASKYILGLIISLTAVLIVLPVNSLVQGFSVTRFTMLSASFFIGLVLASVMLICTYKFGSQKGRMILIFAILLVSIPFGILLGVESLDKAVTNLIFESSSVMAGIAVFAIAILIYAFSFVISCKICEKKEV